MTTCANQFSRQISYAKIIDCSLMFCLLVGVSSLSRGRTKANKLYSPRQKTKTNFSLKLARPPARKNKFSQLGKPFHFDKPCPNASNN